MTVTVRLDLSGNINMQVQKKEELNNITFLLVSFYTRYGYFIFFIIIDNKMKFCAILIFAILCQTVVKSTIIHNEINNNITFIEDIKNWLKITHVIILYDDTSDNGKLQT